MVKDTLKIPGPLGASRHSRSLAAVRRSLYPVKVLAGAVAPRAVDLVVSSALIALLSPLLLVRALWSRHQAGAVLDATEVIGRHQAPFQRLAFAGTGPLRGLAVWLNVLRGDMAMVGPRPLSAEEAAKVPRRDARSNTSRSGPTSLPGRKR